MITILIFIILFLLIILAVIWLPFIRAILHPNEKPKRDDIRDQTNIRLYREHKAEIEQDYAQQQIDEESYQYLLMELDQSLLQEIETEQQAAQQMPVVSKLSFVWPVTFTCFVLIFSLFSYAKLGAYKALSAQLNAPQANAAASNQPAANEQQQLAAKLVLLKQQLAKDEGNADVWYEYGRTLVLHGDYQAAVNAFDRVITIEGVAADLLGAKAQALYYSHNQKITKDVSDLIDKALALDPLDPSTNVLLGMDNFIHQRYAKAVEYWQRILDSGRDNINTEALASAVTEAKNRLTLTGNGPKVSKDMIKSPELLLNVSIGDAFKAQLKNNPDRVVFVYAVPSNGGRMPVAALKMKVGELPTQVMLNNARAMSPQHNLSSVTKVTIYAVVSQTGSVGIQSGDIKGMIENVDVSTKQPITLVIDHLIP